MIDVDQLVRQARTDSQALGILYDLYYERIFRFCVYRLFAREAAAKSGMLGQEDGQCESKDMYHQIKANVN